MQVDKTTLYDLSIFHKEEEQSVFNHLNYTTTVGGREWLRYLFSNPYSDLKSILDTQGVLQLIIKHEHEWPTNITNGTVMVIEKYYDTPLAEIPHNPDLLTGKLYRLVNAADYSLIKYSVNHFADFVHGIRQLLSIFKNDTIPGILSAILQRADMLVSREVIRDLADTKRDSTLALNKYLKFGRYLKREFKSEALELLDIYSKLDAYYGMAMACKKYRFTFPAFRSQSEPYIRATELYHPLLHTPVSYSVDLTPEGNFMFLTGANMAGKSTFIKAIGVSIYLAHLGMGVPAQHLELTRFDGLLSNIQVEDNITRGESYFFNEVQRIRKTIEKINDGRNWLILIDELFKGTNVQDAMKCSTAVIEGLRKMKNTLFILSTHLYEIGEGLRAYPNIRFYYFETKTEDDQLFFSYHLKEGISNDRLGYLILKREGVVDMLQSL